MRARPATARTMTIAMTTAVLMTSVSSPMRSIAAAAFWSLAGEMTEARPPPIADAAAMT